MCFRAPDPSKPGESTIVVVDSAAVEDDGDMVLFRIEASHFLWRMVRRIAGVLVKVGKRELSVEEFHTLVGRAVRSEARRCRMDGSRGRAFPRTGGLSRLTGMLSSHFERRNQG